MSAEVRLHGAHNARLVVDDQDPRPRTLAHAPDLFTGFTTVNWWSGSTKNQSKTRNAVSEANTAGPRPKATAVATTATRYTIEELAANVSVYGGSRREYPTLLLNTMSTNLAWRSQSSQRSIRDTVSLCDTRYSNWACFPATFQSGRASPALAAGLYGPRSSPYSLLC